MWTRFKPVNGQRDWLALAAVVLLSASFLLGGASRQHELRLALVELAALPLLVIAASRLIQSGEWRVYRWPLGLMVAVAAIPLIQLVPLPSAIWTGLPGREQVRLALDVTDVAAGWGPISLTPDETWRHFLAYLPPAAMLLAVLAGGRTLGRQLVLVCLAAAAISIVLGIAQLSSGGTQLYLWETTSAGSVVGFFANRNHLATLTLMLVSFGAVLAVGRPSGSAGRSMALRWAAICFVALSVIALGIIRSRAGVILIGPTLGAGAVAAWLAAGRGRMGVPFIGGLAAAVAGIAAVAFFAIIPVLDRFDPGATPELRFDRWPLVLETAQVYLPLGSGVGSFDPVYRSVEPLGELDASFFNHAHNEYLEVLMETGWLGAAAVAAFLFWFARSAWSAWIGPASLHRDLQRAASIGIIAMLGHSWVDYPMRTETIAVVFAICCGLLAVSPSDEPGQRTRRRRRRSESVA